MAGIWTTYLHVCADFSYIIQFFWFANVWKWTGAYCYTAKCAIEDVSILKEASEEKQFLLFQHGEIDGKWAMAIYCFAWCRNAYNLV